MNNWQINSWLQKPAKQQAQYPSADALREVTTTLSQLPSLVSEYEVKQLKEQLAEAALNKRFVLQGGDCAESFSDCRSDAITSKLKILLQMSLVLIHGLRKPVTRIGRIAGQYAKPRSSNDETRDGVTLPSYRGDIINFQEFTEASRVPNPQLLLQGYQYSALTLNYIRTLIDSGFASLQHPENWDLDFVQHSSMASDYQRLVKSIADSLDFIKTIDAIRTSSLSRVEFYTSHEALHLPYEQALTKQMEDGHWMDLSAHFLWIGMRTAELDGAHVEFLRGVSNPIGVKVGPAMTEEWLCNLVDTLNPNNEPGRLTLITRFGAEKIQDYLPALIKAVHKTGKIVLWTCDPMHGNTQNTKNNLKTRKFDNILAELSAAFQIHADNGSHLGGVHFELTGENVTECIGGARGLAEEDLADAYRTLVDPRLNYEQSLEMAMLIANNSEKRR